MLGAIIKTISAGLLAAIVFAATASATTTVPRDRVCPVGGETYKSFEIASTSRFGMRLDLEILGPQAHLPYVQCPNGFIVFKEEGEFTSEEIAKLTPIVASSEYQAARQSETPAMLVIMLRRALGESDTDLRHWFFKAATEAEYFEQDQLHQRYLAKAADVYDAYLSAHTEHDEDWWFASVRRADIARQLGRFDEASTAVAKLEAAHGSENAIYLKVAAQIQKKAAAHDPKPASYEDGAQ
jgi:hypothetical protein